MRIALPGDPGRGDRGRRTGAEAADDRTGDHQGDGRRERGGAVADGREEQPGAGQPRGPKRSTRAASTKPAEAELSSRTLPTAPGLGAERGAPAVRGGRRWWGADTRRGTRP